jgi:two-component system, OmpR family, sensor kinase
MPTVSLRLRLVAGLVVLMVFGLTIFGLITYELYSNSQYGQLNGELHSSVIGVSHALAQEAGLSTGHGPANQSQGSGLPGQEGYPGQVVSGPPPGSDDGPMVTPGVFGELLSSSGKVLSSIDTSEHPKISKSLLASVTKKPRVIQTGSATGSTVWLTYIGPLENGCRDVVAIPTTNVVKSLDRLVLIEVSGAAGLLIILSAGAMLVLRRGLSPLERMADTAGQIAAGHLEERVQLEDQKSEVGQLASAFNTMLDEIQGAFAQRDQTEERLRQFLADASHELRTPLTSIRGFAELFRLGANDPRVDKATIIRRIEDESARMKNLVEDLLLLARLDQVRPAQTAPVDLSVLAADACSDAIAMAPDRSVTLGAPEPLVVPGNEAHLRQALANLVSNALRYSPPASPLEVSVNRRDGSAVIEVRDHGPGLEPETLAHAFDRFWQKDSARTGTGAGLGLAIVAGIVSEHRGTISAANAPEGGALFTIRLPLPAGKAAEEPHSRGHAHAGA